MLKDSSPEKWVLKEHSKVKHVLLETYLVSWIKLLGNWNQKICYFDGFAGRGSYEDGTFGSPVKALKIADNYSDHLNKFICAFIEKDKNNFKNLETVLSQERLKLKNPGKIKILTENGEFSRVIERLLNQLDEEKSIFSPSFFFIDPFGFSGIAFKIIERILHNPNTEVFFTFMVRDILRFLSRPDLHNTYTRLFGTEKWKDIIKFSYKEKALVELYREQLHDVLKIKYSMPFRVCEFGTKRTLYYLLHITNDFNAHKMMKDIMFAQSSLGNFAYLSSKNISKRFKTKIFNVNNVKPLKEYLIEKFKGKAITLYQIQKNVCDPWSSEPPYIEKHYRKALKELELEGKIKIERIKSKTKNELRKSDRIIFP